MNEPTRLRDEGDPGEAELLASAASDGPSRDAAERTLAALGIGAGLMASSGVAAGSTGAATSGAGAAGAGAAGAGASSTGSASAGSASVGALATGGTTSSALALTVKWVGLAGIAALVGWAVMGDDAKPQAQRIDDHLSPRLGVIALPPPASDVGDESPSESDAADLPSEPDAAPDAERVDHAPVAAPGAVTKAAGSNAAGSNATSSDGANPDEAPPSYSLTDEITALDRARRALERDPDLALAELASYRARFPGGALRPEADALRVEALARAGRSDEAREAAKRYDRDHPDSPHAERVGAAAE